MKILVTVAYEADVPEDLEPEVLSQLREARKRADAEVRHIMSELYRGMDNVHGTTELHIKD